MENKLPDDYIDKLKNIEDNGYNGNIDVNFSLIPGVQELLLDPPGFDGRFLTEPKPLPPTPVPFMLNVPSCSKKISGIQRFNTFS